MARQNVAYCAPNIETVSSDEIEVLVRGPDMSIRHGVKRSDWLVRGAAGSIKPGVERSETPGSKSPKAIEPAKRPLA